MHKIIGFLNLHDLLAVFELRNVVGPPYFSIISSMTSFCFSIPFENVEEEFDPKSWWEDCFRGQWVNDKKLHFDVQIKISRMKFRLCVKAAWVNSPDYQVLDQSSLLKKFERRIERQVSKTQVEPANEWWFCQWCSSKLERNEDWAHPECNRYAKGGHAWNNWETRGANYVSQLKYCDQMIQILQATVLCKQPFFKAIFLRFLWYFHFYESYDSNFFTDAFLDVWKVSKVSSKCVENDFSKFWSRLKWKSPPKMEKTQIFRDAPKSVLTTFLSALFTFPLIFSFLRVVQGNPYRDCSLIIFSN